MIMEKSIKLQRQESKMIDYLNRTSNHLFLRDGYFIKAFVVEVDGKYIRVSLKFKEGSVDLRMVEIEAKSDNSFALMKYSLFPQYSKSTSIRNFKSMKEKVQLIKELIEKNYSPQNINKIKFEACEILKNKEEDERS